MALLIITTILWAFSFSFYGEYLAGHIDSYFAVLVRVGLAALVFLPFLRTRGHSLKTIGMPALLVQVITGFWMAMQLQPDHGQWLAFGDPVTRLIGIKLFLLLLTVLLALDARFRVIPRLHQPGKLTDMAWHIVPVTLIGIVFVATGVSLRTGWLA